MTTPVKALSWVAFQNLVIIGTLAQALNPDLCWVLTKSLALQLLFVFTAQALRREAETSRALVRPPRASPVCGVSHRARRPWPGGQERI